MDDASFFVSNPLEAKIDSTDSNSGSVVGSERQEQGVDHGAKPRPALPENDVERRTEKGEVTRERERERKNRT